MALPNISIRFKTAASAAVERSEKGVVGLILRETNAGAAGARRLTSVTDIPDSLDAANRGYVERAFLGYVNPPREVLLFVVAANAENLDAALAHFATVEVDYLCGPHGCTAEEAAAIATWVKGRRAEDNIVKAVLPNEAADSEGIVNFTTSAIKVGAQTYSAAEYCSRIAGLIAGTPMNISCTYAPLPEVSDIERLTRAQMDAAIDAGQFILYHDGEKVKVGRGVNSLVTTTADKGESFRKLKIVEAADMIRKDVKRTAEDSYIGKFVNSYDNKCLLISAIKGYFEGMENSGILQSGASVVEVDRNAQEAYLKSVGTDVSKMSEQEIKEANTADRVYLAASIKILDAIEDIAIDIVI